MGEVRIIGGRWKRSRLPVPDAPGLRPTSDRIRETLFNWLGQTLDGWRVLDAFAGSGALGFEAASRGAAEAVLVERDAKLAAGLRASAQRLQAATITVHAADALAWMRAAPRGAFDLILLDPPFADDLFDRALAAAAPLLAGGGLLYVESPREVAPPAGFTRWREGRAGAVYYQLLRREDNPAP
ncbi:MAG: 16S rRNA (guanine(966)-N(2))-methyltransferase RsmD [Roseateles sp.]|uniref:16S rRNA (guanine(966)-N(2))-methyltransferase RsmD n=1 Tax=Roseateles sp. TaxID=1971397 RepID=UPI0039E91FFA